MKTSLRGTLGLGIALCLGLAWGCVKIDVSVHSHDSRALSDPHWISLDDLKKLQPIKSCDDRSSLNEVGKELQQTVAWCWAASSRMVMDYHNTQMKPTRTTDSQCNIVMNVLHNLPSSTNCCPEQTRPGVVSRPSDFINVPSECVRGGWPQWILNEYGFSYRMVRGALDWEALRGEICSVRGPFISVIKWSGGGQHTFVVKGYHDDLKGVAHLKQFVEVYDPYLNDHVDMTLDEFVGNTPQKEYFYQPYSHTLNVVQIRPNAKD